MREAIRCILTLSIALVSAARAQAQAGRYVPLPRLPSGGGVSGGYFIGSCGSCAGTAKELRELTNLQRLDFIGTGITDKGLGVPRLGTNAGWLSWVHTWADCFPSRMRFAVLAQNPGVPEEEEGKLTTWHHTSCFGIMGLHKGVREGARDIQQEWAERTVAADRGPRSRFRGMRSSLAPGR